MAHSYFVLYFYRVSCAEYDRICRYKNGEGLCDPITKGSGCGIQGFPAAFKGIWPIFNIYSNHITFAVVS
ncbi:hypothetical protein D3C80_2029990 [compost metagenome]